MLRDHYLMSDPDLSKQFYQSDRGPTFDTGFLEKSEPPPSGVELFFVGLWESGAVPFRFWRESYFPETRSPYFWAQRVELEDNSDTETDVSVWEREREEKESK